MAPDLKKPNSGPAVVDNIHLGIIYMLIGVLALSGLDAIVKWLTTDYSLPQLIFIRSMVAIVILSPVAWRGGGWTAFKTSKPSVHLWRAFLSLGASYLFFFALGSMKLADIMAIVMTAPVMITALSAPILGEHIGVHRWGAIALACLGMLVVVRPGTEVFDPVALAVIIAAVFYALNMISNRVLKDRETLTALIFYPHFGMVTVSLVLLPWNWTTPDWTDLGLLMILGIFAGIGHLFLTMAFQRAAPPAIAPLEYTGLIWAIMLGYWVWGELPDRFTILGMILIVAGGLYVIRRETRLGIGHAEDLTQDYH